MKGRKTQGTQGLSMAIGMAIIGYPVASIASLVLPCHSMNSWPTLPLLARPTVPRTTWHCRTAPSMPGVKKGSLKLSSKYLPQCPPAAYYAPEFSRARSFQMQRHPAQKSSLISFSLAKKENEEHFFSMCLRNYPAPANRDNLSEMAGVSAKSMIRSSDFARAVEFLTHALHGGIAAPVACFKAR